MKKKYIVACAIVIGIFVFNAMSSLAANKVTFSLNYTGTGTGNVLSQTKGIDASGSNYRAHCNWATGGCKVKISFYNGPSTSELGTNQTVTITRSPSSGNTNVTGTLKHGTSSGGASAYVEKMY